MDFEIDDTDPSVCRSRNPTGFTISQTMSASGFSVHLSNEVGAKLSLCLELIGGDALSRFGLVPTESKTCVWEIGAERRFFVNQTRVDLGLTPEEVIDALAAGLCCGGWGGIGRDQFFGVALLRENTLVRRCYCAPVSRERPPAK